MEYELKYTMYRYVYPYVFWRQNTENNTGFEVIDELSTVH